MAQESTATYHGRIVQGAFETVGRSDSWAEQRVATATIVGKPEDIFDAASPGQSMAEHADWFDGKFNRDYYIRTVEASSEDGAAATLRLSLLNCPNGKTKPYNVTWDVSMEEVQMRLINHPDVQKNCDIDILLKWEDTPAGFRVKVKDDNGSRKVTYYYRGDKWDASTGWEYKEVEGDWNIAYCNAVTQGITTYNKYLPVITKNSYYLELPGVDYNLSHVITGGTVTDFTGADAIGKFSEPDLKVNGYRQGRDGIWFKSGDKFTSQADGTWVRTESWTFTDDTRHTWIYSDEEPN